MAKLLIYSVEYTDRIDEPKIDLMQKTNAEVCVLSVKLCALRRIQCLDTAANVRFISRAVPVLLFQVKVIGNNAVLIDLARVEEFRVVARNRPAIHSG